MENKTKIKVITQDDCMNLVQLSFCEGIEACCKTLEKVVNGNCIDNKKSILAVIEGIRLENIPKMEELRTILEDHEG